MDKTTLNYKVNLPVENEDEKKDFSAKASTKLSMQALVGQCLAAKQPSGPAQPSVAATPNGWGKSQ